MDIHCISTASSLSSFFIFYLSSASHTFFLRSRRSIPRCSQCRASYSFLQLLRTFRIPFLHCVHLIRVDNLIREYIDP